MERLEFRSARRPPDLATEQVISIVIVIVAVAVVVAVIVAVAVAAVYSTLVYHVSVPPS